jgi:opacity protein-like surface antigen
MVHRSPSVRVASDWSGFYFGGDGGFGWETASGTLTDALGASLTGYNYRVNGPVAGLFVGGNYQLGRVVLGVEGDWQFSNLIGNNQTQAPLGAAGVFPTGPFTISTTVKDYASMRGRLGFAFGRFQAFGTAGWAWGNPLTSYALLGGAPFVNQGGRSTGWTAGVGVDYAVTESVIARIEYRHTDLATAGFVSPSTDAAPAANSAPINDLRAGIAYKFLNP